MNKRTIITIIILIALMVPLMIFLIACSKKTSSGSKSSSSGFKMPGLMGEVTDIAGNDVTLKLIQIPKIQTGSRAARSGSGSFSRPSGSGSRSFSRPSGSGSGSNTSSTQRAVQYTGETKEIIIPVGTKIVTTQISSSASSSSRTSSGQFGRGQTPFVEVAISVDKIQIGDTLSFYYAADGTTITQVTVASASSGTAGYGALFGGGGFRRGTGGSTNGGSN